MKKNLRRKASPRVAIIMGSKSDLRVMREAVKVLKGFSISHQVQIISAHRTPHEMLTFASGAEARGLEVIIAGAGGAAHLPGMVASATTLPVIGVPVNVTKLDGLDALLSVVQMPTGVPVATVAIDNAANAALLAAQILGLSDFKLRARLKKYRSAQAKKVKASNRTLAR